MSWLSGAFFGVSLSGQTKSEELKLEGAFTSVSGLNMEISYFPYLEGGSRYTRFFIEEIKPQVLVLERGIVTESDEISLLMSLCSQGVSVPMSGTISLWDRTGAMQRTWDIRDAYLQKYIGPELNSNQPALAVSRMEFLYNGTL